MDEQKITHTSSIKLFRGVQGRYGWEIRVAKDNLNEVIDELKKIDSRMAEEYGNDK